MRRIVLFAIAALLITGCGGGGSGAIPPTQHSRHAAAVSGSPALVQQNSGSSYAPTSIAVSFTTAPAAGDTLIVFFNNNGGTGGAANTYTPPTGWTQVDVDTSHAYNTYASFYHVVASGESNSYVFTPSCACREHAWVAGEYSGVSSTTPVDQHGFRFVSNSASWVTPSETPTQAGDLAVVAMLPTNNGDTWTNAPGWTTDAGPLVQWSGELLEQMQPGTTSVSETSTLSGSSSGYATMILLTPSGTAPPPTPTPIPTATPPPNPQMPSLVQRNSGNPFAPASIAITFTSAPSVGDTLLVFFNNNGNTSGTANTYTPPAGWTQIDLDSSHAYHTYESFYHVVGSSESNRYVFTPSCACRQHVWAAAEYSNAFTAAPVDKHGFRYTSNSTLWTTPAVVPSQANDLAVVMMMPTNTGDSWTNASGWSVDLGPLAQWSGELLEQPQTGVSSVSESSTLSAASSGYGAIVLLAPGAPKPPPAYTDWNTFGVDLARSGYNPGETTVSAGNAASLKLSWSTDLGAAIDAQPLVATGISINGTATNVVYVGAENGIFYALNADTGKVLWKATLGMQSSTCADLPSNQFGITGTATYDKTARRIYVADGQDQLHALDMSTGQEISGWPVAVATTPNQDHIYGALTLNANNGMLYVETGSICDISPWHGRIAVVNTTTASVVTTFFPAAPYDGAGIWGMGGASVDPGTNNVYVATGNDDVAPAQTSAYGDAVVQLDANLNVLASNTAAILENDQDYGATPLLYRPSGCAEQASVKNKSGVLNTYNVTGIGSGPLQALAVAKPSVDGAFIGVPSFDPVTNLVYVGSPSDNGNFQHGLIAFSELSGCAGLTRAWKQSIGPNTTANDNAAATIANGVVYYVDGIGNEVFAYNAATGAPLWNSGTIITGHALTPPTIDGRLFIPSWDHKLYAFGV